MKCLNRNKNRVIATLLAVIICLSCFPYKTNEVFAASRKVLNVNWNHIAVVGNQPSGSDACACYAVAFSRTMLDGRAHSWTEYDYNGGGNAYNTSCCWSWGDYGSTGLSTAQAAYKACYDSINNNRPAIIHVHGARGTNTYGHYITIIGYENVTDVNNLSPSNFLFIDSVQGTTKSSAENMGAVGYTARYDPDSSGNYHIHLTSSGSVGPADSTPPVISNIKVTNITANGYDVTCDVSDNVGIDRVEFPTWTKANDQDDLQKPWPIGTYSNGKAYFHVNRKDHKNEFGAYVTHIYAYDTSGNVTGNNEAGIITLVDGKSPVSGSFRNHEYIVSNGNLTATEAKGLEKDGWHLATITSKEEDDYVVSLIGKISNQSDGYWVGASNVSYENQFLWDTGEPFSYSRWAQGNPDNLSKEHYLLICGKDFLGIWNNVVENCKMGYILEKDPIPSTASGKYNNHEYFVSAEYMTRENAEALQEDGWYLATITSKNERDYVLSLINDLEEQNLRGYWLGGSDVAKEGTFAWDNGEAFSFADWEEGQPNNINMLGLNENYLVMLNNGKFNDSNEIYYHGYVLERDPQSMVVKVDSINLTSDRDDTKDAYEDDTFQLTASVLPENATDKTVKWTSSDTKYATVDSTGKVTVLHTIPNQIKTIKISAVSNDGNASSEYTFVVCSRSSCEHVWNEGSITKYSTCSEQGEKEFTCTKCGTKKTEYIALKNHTVVKDLAEPASCNSTGLSEGYHCSECGAIIVKQTVVPRLKHIYDEGIVTTEPTTTSTGVKTFTCTLCGNTYDEIIPKKETEKKHVQSVGISLSSLYLDKGNVFKLFATILPEDADDKEIKWSSGNMNVAMVNADGYVAAIGRGRTTITATASDGNITDNCVVTVWEKYDKPVAPTLKAATIDSIEVNKVSGCEYSKDLINWQSSTIFTDLSADTEYTIYARKMENTSEYYSVSDASNGTIMRTASKNSENNQQNDPTNNPTDKSDNNKTAEPQKTETPTQSTIPVYDQSDDDKTIDIPGVGVISEDGTILTDEEGDNYYISTKLTSKMLKKNALIADKKSNGKYRITKITKKSGKITGGNVTYMAPYNRNCKAASVPNKVKLGGVTFKVTELQKNAFKNCKKISSINFGVNISKIGANAFNGCSKLSKITIRSSNLRSIGANAFKGINSKAKFKVPKKQLKKYTKMIKNAKAPKKAKITK